jgi:hypothetical protein
MNEEKQFVDGILAKAPPSNAPDFIKAKLSIKLDDFKKWVRQVVEADPDIEWINIEIKESIKGMWYAERDTWKPGDDPGVRSLIKNFKPEPGSLDASSGRFSGKASSEDIPW